MEDRYFNAVVSYVQRGDIQKVAPSFFSTSKWAAARKPMREIKKQFKTWAKQFVVHEGKEAACTYLGFLFGFFCC